MKFARPKEKSVAEVLVSRRLNREWRRKNAWASG